MTELVTISSAYTRITKNKTKKTLSVQFLLARFDLRFWPSHDTLGNSTGHSVTLSKFTRIHFSLGQSTGQTVTALGWTSITR